ncbi:MAG: adenylate/guanylate cyclase domain-containing protein [Nitratireductor sp.]|nr:adenylate/guanylate cyclase domain-containing protein [Nitratireductor sp.]
MQFRSVWLDRQKFYLWLSMSIAGGLVGLAYVALVYPQDATGQGSSLLGLVIGLLIGSSIAAFELFFVTHPYSVIRRLSFVPALLVRVGVHFALISSIIALCQIGYDRINGTEIFELTTQGLINHLTDVSFSLVVSAAIVFYMQMRIYIGNPTLLDVVIGRYARPHVEGHIFAIFDIPGTTKTAQKIGDVAFHRYLNQLFVLFDRPVTRNGGVVHSYVGDALIAVWPLRDDKSANARVLAAVREVVEICKAEADHVETLFGARPGVRVAIHGGDIVVGETGDSKRQITYLGDVMNIASRIEAKTKELNRPLLVSAELLERMVIPEGMHAEAIGAHDVKGSQRAIELAELHID